MSATNRGPNSNSDPSQYFATPAWVTRRLLERVDLPNGLWLEPSAGEGAIIRAVAEMRSAIRWHAVEYRAECLPALRALSVVEVAQTSSFQRAALGRYAVCLGNPPYAAALEFVQHALGCAEVVVMLLRLNWLASAKRAEWMRQHPPCLFVLPDRPSFVGTGGDATDYAWMAWGLRNPPTVEILGSTSPGEREGHALRERWQRDLFAAP